MYRNVSGGNAFWGWAGDDTCGMFKVPSPVDKAELTIVASAGDGWDHVSVSRRNRCPNWAEMEHVKRLFFKDEETAMQLHVPPSDHINCHPTCLHLWRPLDAEIPRPPSSMVGPSDAPKAALTPEDIAALRQILGDALATAHSSTGE
jgi:hypothetical protein